MPSFTKCCTRMLTTWLISFTCQRSHISVPLSLTYVVFATYISVCFAVVSVCPCNKPLKLRTLTLFPAVPRLYLSATAARPSHHLVFDHLQYAKTNREGLVCLSRGWRQVDRGRRGPWWKEYISHMCSLFWTRSSTSLLRKRLKLQHLGQKLQDKASSLFFRWGTHPPTT